ncbi:MAG: hypothetical protein IPG32_16080 [Saprospirales bacterium]|nr:hypothetical protein [Saprospirales bacterium]
MVDPPGSVSKNFRLQWVPLYTDNKILSYGFGKVDLNGTLYRGKTLVAWGGTAISLRVPQLKMLFTRNNELANNINEFIGVRTSEIVSNRGYFNINAALPTLILHIIPIQHFEDGSGFDFYQIYQTPEKLVPLANTQQPSSFH